MKVVSRMLSPVPWPTASRPVDGTSGSGPRCRILPILLVAALSLGPVASEAAAQNAPRNFQFGFSTGVGYSGVVDSALLGVGVIQMLGPDRMGGSWGLFADAKMRTGSLTRDPFFYEDWTPDFVEENFNDRWVKDEDEFVLLNAGLVRALTPELALLAGVGAANRNRIREYFDLSPDRERSDVGSYFVEVPDQSGWEPSAVVGALLRLGPGVVVRFGYESAPGGFSVGGYWMMSR